MSQNQNNCLDVYLPNLDIAHYFQSEAILKAVIFGTGDVRNV